MSDAALTYAALAIMAFALVWRIALRPHVVRWLGIESTPNRLPPKWALTSYFGIAILDVAVAIAILLVWPRFAWAALIVIVAGQEIRYWVFNFLVVRARPTDC